MKKSKNKNKSKGHLIVVTGCMGSGKTEEVIRLLNRALIGKREVVVFKPDMDTRSAGEIKSRNGRVFAAVEISVKNPEEILNQAKKAKCVFVDEIHFFNRALIAVIDSLINDGKQVITSGLDTDFKGEPFGIVPDLIAISDSHIQLTAVCMKCRGENANRSQRFINGKPAPYDSPLIVVGGDEQYEARCRDCHEVPR